MGRTIWGLILLLSLLWAGTFLLTVPLLEHLPPITIVVLRTALAAAVLAVALPLMGVSLPKGQQWLALSVLGVFSSALPFALITSAQREISPALTSILNSTMPIFTLIALRIFLGERLGALRLFGVVTGVSGVAIMLMGAASGSLGAIVSCLIAAASHGLGAIYTLRLQRHGVLPQQAAFGQLFWAPILLLPVCLIFEQPWTLPVAPLWVYLTLIGIAIFSTAFGYLIYFKILGAAGALASSLVTLVIPVSTILLSALIYRTLPEARHLAGMALIASGLGLIEWARRRHVARVLPPAEPLPKLA